MRDASATSSRKAGEDFISSRARRVPLSSVHQESAPGIAYVGAPRNLLPLAAREAQRHQSVAQASACNPSGNAAVPRATFQPLQRDLPGTAMFIVPHEAISRVCIQADTSI